MWLRIVDCVYTTETDGYRQETPVVHLFGRDREWRRHHIRVDTFRPYFAVRQSEWAEHGEDIAADDRVQSVETTDLRGRPERALDGEPLVRVVCRTPSAVGELRELVDDPFEADVQFPTRFLIDVASAQWVEIDATALESDEPVPLEVITLPDYETSESDVQPPEQVPPPRVCTYDIEVQQGGSGPPVVSTEGTERAANPITSICAHDSYTDEYGLWVLTHDEWTPEDAEAVRSVVEDTDVPVDVHLYANPHDVVAQFCQWVTERDFDALTGWNAASFDHPYLVNYGRQNGISAVYNLSPTGDVYPMDGDGSFINSSLKGRLLLDSMSLYEKTSVHELDSKRLDAIAELEDVSVGKLDLDDAVDAPSDEPTIDYAWEHDPRTFAEYSLRDVRACVGINRESKESVHIV